jgi:hypothetical protein
MAKYPIKMLKDEEGNPFVPLINIDAIKELGGETLMETIDGKLEVTNIIAGRQIDLDVDGNNITINNSSEGTKLINNLDTATSGTGALDAAQGKVLKDSIPEVINNLTTIDSKKALSAHQGYILAGRSVPVGGGMGQVLMKSADDDYSLTWGDAADPNAIVGDGSIKKIVELTYSEYTALEEAGQLEDTTEYHISDMNEQGGTYITENEIQSLIDNTTKNYLPLSGGVMTGVLTAPSGLYMSAQKFGMSLGNSDLVEFNGIFFGDSRNTSEEGLHYARSNGNYDTLYALDGNLYLSVNNSLVTDGTAQLIPSCSPWQSFTFHNSEHFYAHSTSSSSGYSRPAYRKMGDCVMLKGLISIPGTLEDCSEEICKITDTSCIPKYKAYFPVASSINENPNGKAVTVTLGTDGILRVHACDVGGWISLDGIMIPLNN